MTDTACFSNQIAGAEGLIHILFSKIMFLVKSTPIKITFESIIRVKVHLDMLAKTIPLQCPHKDYLDHSDLPIIILLA